MRVSGLGFRVCRFKLAPFQTHMEAAMVAFLKARHFSMLVCGGGGGSVLGSRAVD